MQLEDANFKPKITKVSFYYSKFILSSYTLTTNKYILDKFIYNFGK